MNYQKLRQALKIKNGQVTVSSTLSPTISDLLANSYNNQSLTIQGAQPGPGDNVDQKVVITGRSNFLNVADLPLVATFSLDEKGNVRALLKYKLLGEMPGPNDWKFSRSFPQLPVSSSNTVSIKGTPRSPLDALSLFNASFVVTTHPLPKPDYEVDLEPGINFVSQMKPTGLLGIFESTIGDSNTLTIYGPIHIPKATDVTLPLKPLQYPWDRKPPVPGINLTADLDINLKLGELVFDEASFLLYSPHSTDWMDQNDTFEPELAYTGKLSIPSADVSTVMLAAMQPGDRNVLLRGSFEGAEIGKLANMVSMAGPSDLVSSMPDQLKTVGDALGKLELMEAAVSLSVDQTGLRVSGTYFTIGMRELNWQIWDDHFQINEIACSFAIRSPFQSPSLSVKVMGTFEIEGVPLKVYASNVEGFTVYAELGEDQTIPLKQLMQTYVPEVPPPGNLTINTLQVSVAPYASYSMAMAMAQGEDAWVLDVGFQKLAVSDVDMTFFAPKGGRLTGSFGGTIAFGNIAKLNMRYDIPGSFVIKAQFPLVKLSELIETLSNQEVSLPDGFDLTFINSYILIKKTGEQSLVFQLGTQLEGVGSFAFEVRKVTGTEWGVAAGLDLALGKASDLPALGPLSFFQDLFNLQKLVLVISTFEDTAFNFPNLADFNTPQLPAKQLSLPGRSGVIAGFNLHGQWVINTADQQQNLLGRLLGLNPVLDITLQIGMDPMKDSRLYVGYRTTIQGHPLICKFGGQLTDGSISLFLTGSMTVSIQGTDQTFTVALLFVQNGAFISATMKGTTPITFSYEGVELFKLGNLALEIGINWDGIPSLGIAGTIIVADHEFAVAVFFDSAEPKKSMVAGALSDITLKEILNAMTGNVIPSEIDDVLEQIALKGTQQFEIPGSFATDLDNLKIDSLATAFAAKGVSIPSTSQQVFLAVDNPGERWYLTDLKNKARHYQLVKKNGNIEVSVEAQMYCVPQRTAIGELTFEQAFYINGAITFLGFDAMATVEIDPNKGIAVDGQMDKIVIGSERLFSITAATGEGGPRISAATFTQANQKEDKFRPPHFYINGHMEILGLSREMFVSVTKSGLEFDFNGQMLPPVYLDMHGKANSSTYLGLGGTARVGIRSIDLGPLGSIDLDTYAEGALDIKVDAEVILATMEASFKFAGEGYDVSKFDLDVKTEALKNLAETLYDKIKDILLDLLKDAERWAKLVGEGFIKGVDDTVKVLQEQFGKSLDEAKKIANVVGDAASDAASEVKDAASKGCSATTAALKL